MIDLSTLPALYEKLEARETVQDEFATLHPLANPNGPEAITALKALEAENAYRLSFLHIQDKRIAGLEAENRAMQEALERISGFTMSMFATTDDMASEAKRAASAALATKGADSND